MNDTIAAISTTMGVGAISIIRVSGNEAINIVNKICTVMRLIHMARRVFLNRILIWSFTPCCRG